MRVFLIYKSRLPVGPRDAESLTGAFWLGERYFANRPAQVLIPPLRLIKRSSGSEWFLYFSAYRSTRDHLDRVRLSTLPGSEVQRMTAANGSLVVGESAPWSHNARCARPTAWCSAFHHITRSKTAVK